MTSTAKTPDDYIASLPGECRTAVQKLREVIVKNLPAGFAETMYCGMPGYVVPHSKYPAGYHCNPKDPLPFVSFASQKNFVALYHMGLYSSKELLDWFTKEYPKHSKTKLDMGKSCIRFKNPAQIPYTLLGELMKKITPEKWIGTYEATVKPQPQSLSGKTQ